MEGRGVIWHNRERGIPVSRWVGFKSAVIPVQLNTGGIEESGSNLLLETIIAHQGNSLTTDHDRFQNT